MRPRPCEDAIGCEKTVDRQEAAELQGPKRARLAWTQRMDRKAKAVEAGDLRPGHLRAKKPE